MVCSILESICTRGGVNSKDHTRGGVNSDHSVSTEQGKFRSLIKRMKFVNCRATIAKSKMMINNVEELKMDFYNDFVSIIKMMDIP